ncbi:MAG TPA: SufE family protein [Rhodothermales bacterium]
MSARDTIAERSRQIVEEFALFDDWMGRYEYLIELGKSLPMIDERYRDEEHKIHGCQSQVWVHGDLVNDVMEYTGDSDAMITRGLVAILVRVLSGQPPEAVATANLSFLDEIGLKEHLSPTRKNGLAGMIRQMKRYAIQQAADQ